MKTEALFYRGAGGVEVLEFGELELRAPRADEVRVSVVAVGLNRADVLQRKGVYPAPDGALVDVPGLEYAGIVEAVGADVTGVRAGQRAMGIVAAGAMARHLVVDASLVLPIPDTVDIESAAAYPEGYLTAFDALILQAGLCAGETALVHAVGGGVGVAALQLAKAWGATVVGTSRTPAKLARCIELGMDHGVHVENGLFAAATRKCAHGVDVVLDTVGAAYLEENLRVLREKGRLVLLGLLGGTQAQLSLGRLLSRRLHLIGTVLRGRSVAEKSDLVARFKAAVLPLVSDGTLVPVIDEVIAMKEVARAHQRLEANDAFGKIVLRW